MSQPKLITKPFASDALPGYVNEIPKENPVGAPEQNASWSEGFPPITMTDIDDGGLPPNGEDMNGVLRAITEHNLFIGGGGVYEFTDDYITEVGGYSKGAVLISDDKTALWMSIQDNNTQNFNGATKTQWRRIAFTELDSTLAGIQNALNTKADKSVTITAGDGLTGGGTLAGDRVLAVNSSVVRTDRTITAGTGLSGGGNLSTNRTLSVNYGTTAGTAAQGNDSRITGAAQKSANLSDLASAGAARQNLGLGTAATRDVGTASGNVMEVGAFGLGRLPHDGYQVPNISTIGTGFSFQPPNGGISFGDYTPVVNSLILSMNQFGGNNGLALSGSYNDRRVYIYFKQAYEWKSRLELLSTGNILHTPGQSTQYPMTQKAVTDALDTKANTSTQVKAGTGLSGGGNLSANRTLSVNYGTTAGTAAQGNDSRITGAAQKSANLSDLVNAGAARQNLGLGTAATRDVGTASGNVMEVGAFGLGGPYTNTNITTGSYIGRYDPATPPVGYPAGWYSYGSILSMRHGYGGTHAEIVIPHTGNGGIKFRHSRDANFIDILHTGNILTTTGQSTQYPMTQKATTDALNTKVGLTGNQTIEGTKTFSTFPVTPSAAPTANYQVANKKYVDDSAIGVGQTWQDVTGSRSAGTTYTNTTGRPITISVSHFASGSAGNTPGVTGYVGSVLVQRVAPSTSGGAAGTVGSSISILVPSGATYRIELTGYVLNRVVTWVELR